MYQCSTGCFDNPINMFKYLHFEKHLERVEANSFHEPISQNRVQVSEIPNR